MGALTNDYGILLHHSWPIISPPGRGPNIPIPQYIGILRVTIPCQKQCFKTCVALKKAILFEAGFYSSTDLFSSVRNPLA